MATPTSMSDRDGKIWMDGQMVEWRDAKIHVLTHTLHYGCGAFEGVRAYNTAQGTAIFRLQEHTERLFNSAKILRMQIPFTPDEVMQAQRDVVGFGAALLQTSTLTLDGALGAGAVIALVAGVLAIVSGLFMRQPKVEVVPVGM